MNTVETGVKLLAEAVVSAVEATIQDDPDDLASTDVGVRTLDYLGRAVRRIARNELVSPDFSFALQTEISIRQLPMIRARMRLSAPPFLK